MIRIKEDAIEIIDEESKLKRIKGFSNVKEVAEGEAFIAILFHDGKLEVYTKQLQLIGSRVVSEASGIIANSRIVVKLSNGVIEFYDKHLNLQFTRRAA